MIYFLLKKFQVIFSNFIENLIKKSNKFLSFLISTHNIKFNYIPKDILNYQDR